MDNEMIDSYWAYMQSQCSSYFHGCDDYLAGEIVSQWFHRKSLRRQMVSQEAELARLDGVLSGLFYEMKKKLSRLGRNGGWSKWLKQHKIPRSTADRLVMEHVEFFGLHNELPQRERPEPLEGNVSAAACRVSDRHEQMLKSPRSRMIFMTCLADRLGLAVDFNEDGSLRVSTPPPVSDEYISEPVPHLIEIQAGWDCETR